MLVSTHAEEAALQSIYKRWIHKYDIQNLNILIWKQNKNGDIKPVYCCDWCKKLITKRNFPINNVITFNEIFCNYVNNYINITLNINTDTTTYTTTDTDSDTDTTADTDSDTDSDNGTDVHKTPIKCSCKHDTTYYLMIENATAKQHHMRTLFKKYHR